MVFALLLSSKLFKRYFQAHPIHVLTDKPLKQVPSNHEYTGRMSKWVFELSEHEITFGSRHSI